MSIGDEPAGRITVPPPPRAPFDAPSMGSVGSREAATEFCASYYCIAPQQRSL
jgi:hypothetical protein